MIEALLHQIREQLLRGGVAARHANRATLEMQAHFDDLRDLSLARGKSRRVASIEAHERLGGNSSLINGFARQRALPSRMSRHARSVY